MFVLGTASRDGRGTVVDGGREFLVVPGSRTDAIRTMRGVVLWGGLAGIVLVTIGVLVIAVRTGAL